MVVIVEHAVKVRIYPNVAQETLLAKTFGCKRWICGYKHDTLTLKEREWTCPECGIHHDRDANAAKNLDGEGKRILGEERNITIIKTSTVGTTGSHASGDRVRPAITGAVIDEGRIHAL